MPAAIEIPTTLAHARGAYTATAHFGEHGDAAQLILDTGSSTLVVRPHAYAPARDGHLAATPWVQEIRYGGGAWAGPVLQSRLAFGHGHHARAIDDALFACCETDDALFQGADGLWGLAFRGLDPSWDVSPLLSEQGHASEEITRHVEQIAQAAKEFRVYYKKVPTGSSYTMDHTALSYLFDREGHIRVVLRHEQTADDYTADIRQLLAEKPV